MRKARDTVSVDDHAGGHTRYFESLSEGALRIELNSEAGMESVQELLGVGPIVIKVDGNHCQTLVRRHSSLPATTERTAGRARTRMPRSPNR